MKIKSFGKFVESLKIDVSVINLDINESLGILYEKILKSVGAEEVDIYTTFNLPKESFEDKLNLDMLTNNGEFVNSLSSIGLKKSNVQNTEDFETYLNKPCRFMLIYNIEANELENPKYIIFQSYNKTLEKWEDIKLYQMSGDIKNFYDKISSRVIEIEDGEDKYIYQTSNKNEWTLQNLEKETDIYKKYLRTDDFEKLINTKGVNINVI